MYNGIPAYRISLSDKKQSKAKLQTYCESLLGYVPDFVFTHVTRLVKSKGLWRDLRVLEHIEREFRTQGKTGVLFLLSTEVSQRRNKDIYNMESNYKWPVAHREGMPDLSGGEANFYTNIQEFNAKSRNIKVIFVNQFGFDPINCGKRMPVDMEFMDIRKGSDVEFGQSIYEPFGIAQLEPLTFGGVCVISNVCGCAGFIMDSTGCEGIKNVVIADYTKLNGHYSANINSLKKINQKTRWQIEHSVSEKVAMQVCSRLPKNDTEMENMIQVGYKLAKNMSWEAVVKNRVLPCLQKAMRKGHRAPSFTRS